MPPIPASALLPTRTAHLLALSFSASYVGCLYVVGKLVPGPRDKPAVIRARLAAVSVVSVASCMVVGRLVSRSGQLWPLDARTVKALGFVLPSSIYPCLQTPLLFLGPLYAAALSRFLFPEASPSVSGFLRNLTTWIGFRNYAWAPLTEEVVFRSCVLAVYSMSGAARWKMVAFAPLVFGLAHVHHALDVYTRLGRTKKALQQAVFSALFQTAYTTLFGAHASWLFLRSGSIVPPLVAHVFCNIMGVPQLGAEVQQMPQYKTSIYAAYLLGIGAFGWTIRSWTA
uniref:intramembrane prenyl-peptidase Rce1 n=1 Tax=Mycena chlorophos TaxID=658473 RepID=A0ABQ0L7D8_MYCCL|nr:predicted protein [Mycena chlorophos]